MYLTKYNLKDVDWDTNGKTGLSDEQSGMVSNYNDEMQVIKRAMRRSGNYDKNTYYLFLVPRSENTGMQGYMPLKNQYGFIFTEASQNRTELGITRTIAHELSHGCFRLRHTFSPNNSYIANQGTTENLMDYVTPTHEKPATHLRKYQWDLVHDPETMVGVFEDDGEGAYEEDILDLSLYKLGVELGYKIWVQEESGQAMIQKTDLLLKDKSENEVSFYIRRMIFFIKPTVGSVKIHSISETRIEYRFFKTESGVVFTDNGDNTTSDVFSGVVVDDRVIEEFETIYPVDYFENYEESEKYVEDYDNFVLSFKLLLEKQPYLVKGGELKAKYRCYDLGNLVEFLLKFGEEWMKNKEPVTLLLEMLAPDVDIVKEAKYKVNYQDIKEAIEYFNVESQKELYIPPNKL